MLKTTRPSRANQPAFAGCYPHSSVKLLSDLVRSPVRAELLRVFFGLRQGSLYRAELIAQMPFAKESVETQLNALKRMGLVVSEKDGNRAYYSANTSHPLYSDLRNIVLTTVGLHDVLASALSDPEVEFAFVFGSIAAGTETPESDIDLMVIGAVTEYRFSSKLKEPELMFIPTAKSSAGSKPMITSSTTCFRSPVSS